MDIAIRGNAGKMDSMDLLAMSIQTSAKLAFFSVRNKKTSYKEQIYFKIDSIMKIAIIQFPGSNCERETTLAVERAQMEAVPFLWNESKEKLTSCDGFILVGGFSYEDRGRAGIISSLDPIMEDIKHAAEMGKPVLGICNGAQILVESGLVPGIKNYRLGLSLATNKRIKNSHILGTGFYNDWVYIKPAKQTNNAFLRHFDQKNPLYLPVAHGEGRFILAPKLLSTLQEKQVGMLQYCDVKGTIKDEFPINPNGSENNLAALCNIHGNVMAIMPHPERTANGDIIFSSMRDYIAENNFSPASMLDFSLPQKNLALYRLPSNAFEIIVQLIINDNITMSMQKALQQLNCPVKIKRQTHWEITYQDDAPKLKQELIDSCELFNPNKEKLVNASTTSPKNTLLILTQDIDNLLGKYKLDQLKNLGINNIKEIKHGTLWHISSDLQEISEIQKILLEKNILFNPFASNGFFYTI